MIGELCERGSKRAQGEGGVSLLKVYVEHVLGKEEEEEESTLTRRVDLDCTIGVRRGNKEFVERETAWPLLFTVYDILIIASLFEFSIDVCCCSCLCRWKMTLEKDFVQWRGDGV